MIKVPTSPDFDKNIQRGRGDAQRCVVCGKPCGNPKWMIHLHGGGDVAVTEEEAHQMDESDDMGFHPIGNDCLKSHPALRRYAVDQRPRKTKKAAMDWQALYADLYRQTHGESATNREIQADARKRSKLI